ncbi:MAG: ribose-5-phosphate isomerase [Bifidobacteriaceae bacterium]|jgi:ribose 5-phosphate isomerase B|nr:ribose-5-phosphate isomerase [Bifidobacteriaceae bacterium]
MAEAWRVVVGSDEAGFEYKEAIKADLRADARVAEVIDVGVNDKGATTAYPAVAIAAANALGAGQADRAVLVCGTGIGMAITANKAPGIRAAVVHDSFSGERAALSNDVQVITLGQRVIGLDLARRLVHEWLGYHFDPGSASARKIELIDRYEHTESEL